MSVMKSSILCSLPHLALTIMIPCGGQLADLVRLYFEFMPITVLTAIFFSYLAFEKVKIFSRLNKNEMNFM